MPPQTRGMVRRANEARLAEPRLPVEMWLQIFDDVFESAGTNFFAYNEAKKDVCNSFPEWNTIVCGHALYWTKLAIDCVTLPDDVTKCLEYSRGRSMDVTILLDPVHAIDHPVDSEQLSMPIRRNDMHSRIALVHRCLLAAMPSLLSWNEVCLWATSNVFMALLLDFFRNANAPNISSLFLSNSTSEYYFRAHGMFAAPPPIFSGNLPNLEILRIVDVALPWGNANYFSRLQRLHLGSLDSTVWPTGPDLASTLGSSPVLRDLVLGGLGVLAAGMLPVAPFLMPSLESLTLFGTAECAMVIAVLREALTPVLHELILHNLDRSSWVALLTLPIFPKLEELFIGGGRDSASHGPRVLRRCESLIYLDVTFASLHYFDTLHFYPLFCPSLRSLAISDVPLSRLCSYLHTRHVRSPACARIEVLEYTHSIPFPITYDQFFTVSSIVLLVHTFHAHPPLT